MAKQYSDRQTFPDAGEQAARRRRTARLRWDLFFMFAPVLLSMAAPFIFQFASPYFDNAFGAHLKSSILSSMATGMIAGVLWLLGSLSSLSLSSRHSDDWGMAIASLVLWAAGFGAWVIFWITFAVSA